jgi:hypothetical protein
VPGIVDSGTIPRHREPRRGPDPVFRMASLPPAARNGGCVSRSFDRRYQELFSADKRKMSRSAADPSSGTALGREIDGSRRPMSPRRPCRNHTRVTPGRRRFELCGRGTKGGGRQVIADNDEPSVTGTAFADLMVQCPGTTPTGRRRQNGTCDRTRVFAQISQKKEITLLRRIAKERRRVYVVAA